MVAVHSISQERILFQSGLKVAQISFRVCVLSRSYCCYGNLLCYENYNNVLANDWSIFWWHDCSIKKKRVAINDPSKSKCWNPFWAMLKRKKPLALHWNKNTNDKLWTIGQDLDRLSVHVWLEKSIFTLQYKLIKNRPYF